MVVEAGKVAEEGTHAELMARGGAYHALQAAQTLASPHKPMGPPPLPMGFAGANLSNNKARKRKLEHEMDDKEKKEHGEGADDGQDDVEGMFDTLGVHEDGDGIRVTDLLDADLLAPRRRPAGSRSKAKEKEKGKPTRCRCDRSGCLKRYCVCFAAGGLCAPDCKCKDCKNDDSTEERRAARAAAATGDCSTPRRADACVKVVGNGKRDPRKSGFEGTSPNQGRWRRGAFGRECRR